MTAFSLDKAIETLNNFSPVSFKYRKDFIENSDDLKLGFIAEDVPDLLAALPACKPVITAAETTSKNRL
ncbi:tail fiber domain-containing protein [candidate division KSB1 bacterium]|nr:tail fiber domain-containing protein [candidate division KSB1 bacterium]